MTVPIGVGDHLRDPDPEDRPPPPPPYEGPHLCSNCAVSRLCHVNHAILAMSDGHVIAIGSCDFQVPIAEETDAPPAQDV